ncbi:MAG: GMC family oxidoreductase [Candidatus Eremiobacteraeota bacterium]|nr:GMC family oxidoreductase [Candidatus Eremiobacteraeota bacterium]
MQQRFDYIVVGAGTTGCLIAGCLSRSGKSVLIIETGNFPKHLEAEVLSDWLSLLGTDVDYAYRAESIDRSSPIIWNRGRVVGGSGVINGMLHLRGLDADYDSWEQALRDTFWKPQLVHATFDNLEYRGPPSAPPFMVCVQPQDPLSTWSDRFYDACRNYGFESGSADPRISFGVCHYSIASCSLRRSSTFTSHLLPVLPRVHLLTNTTVGRILFSRSGNRTEAIGACTVDGDSFHADSDVIICCGAVETPLLLLRSGIGPSRTLTSLGVPCIVQNENVGRNLADHPRLRLRFPCTRTYSVSAGSTGTEVGLFLNVSHERQDGTPEIQCFVKPPTAERDFSECVISVALTHPLSLGYVDTDSLDMMKPKIYPGYFSHPQDIAKLKAGARRIQDLLAHHAERLELRSDWWDWLPEPPMLESFIRSNAQTTWHHSCTARMARSDDVGVVDSEHRVFGTANLRIGDTSAFPDIPTANTNAPAIIFAQHLANQLLKQH